MATSKMRCEKADRPTGIVNPSLTLLISRAISIPQTVLFTELMGIGPSTKQIQNGYLPDFFINLLSGDLRSWGLKASDGGTSARQAAARVRSGVSSERANQGSKMKNGRQVSMHQRAVSKVIRDDHSMTNSTVAAQPELALR